jgi:hypothetical protein
MRRWFAFALCGLGLGACTSSGGVGDLFPRIETGPAASVLRLQTQPPGAEAATSTNQTCHTPCNLTVATTENFKVTFRLAGHHPVEVDIQAIRGLDASDPPVRFIPNPVVIELEKVPPPVRRRRPATRRPATTAPKPAATRPAARPAARPAPAPAAAPAPAPAAAPAPPPAAAPPAASPWPPAPGQQR